MRKNVDVNGQKEGEEGQEGDSFKEEETEREVFA